MKCKRCNKEIDESSNFCPFCGVRNAPASQVSEPSPVVNIVKPTKKVSIDEGYILGSESPEFIDNPTFGQKFKGLILPTILAIVSCLIAMVVLSTLFGYPTGIGWRVLMGVVAIWTLIYLRNWFKRLLNKRIMRRISISYIKGDKYLGRTFVDEDGVSQTVFKKDAATVREAAYYVFHTKNNVQSITSGMVSEEYLSERDFID